MSIKSILSLLLCAFLIVLFSNVAFAQSPSPQMPRTENNRYLYSGSKCEKTLFRQLYQIIDPELDINIVDMGLVRLVRCDEAQKINTVTIILTSPFCPFTKKLVSDIKKTGKKTFPQHETRVVVDMKTRWSAAYMSPEAKKKLWGIEE